MQATLLCRARLSLQLRSRASRAMASMSRGCFIVFEGADRSGKTTQCTNLTKHLQEAGHKVELWRFPDRETQIGQMINGYLTSKTNLSDQAIHLLFSANRWEKQKLLEDTLAAGTTVVMDRYAFSGVCYSAAKGVPGMGLDWCKVNCPPHHTDCPQLPDAGLPAPDAVIFLDLTEEQAAKRGQYGEERYERPAFQKKVLELFRSIREPWWDVIDAGRAEEAVGADVRHAAQRAIERVAAGQPLRRLWDYK